MGVGGGVGVGVGVGKGVGVGVGEGGGGMKLQPLTLANPTRLFPTSNITSKPAMKASPRIASPADAPETIPIVMDVLSQGKK